VWVGALPPASNLLGPPVQPELIGHDTTQGTFLRQFTVLRTTRPIPRSLIRLTGPVTSATVLMADLAAHGRGGASQCSRNRTDQVAGHDAAGDLYGFRQRQRQSRVPSLRRPNPSGRPNDVLN
jgi:hypothetical protein